MADPSQPPGSKPGQFSCIACHQAKRACDKRHPCGRCMKQGIECVMQTRGRGRPPRNMQEGGGASQPSTGRGSRSEDGQPTGVAPPPTRAPAQSAAGGMAAALHQLPSAPMGHMSARSIASSLSGTSEGSSIGDLSSDGEENDVSSSSVSRKRPAPSPHPATIITRLVSVAPPTDGDASQRALVKSAFAACAKSLWQIREEGALDWAKAACFRSVMEYIFVMAGESQSWASFSSDLEPEQPLPPEMVVSRRNGVDSASWAAELMFVPDSHCTRFILGTLNNPVNKEVRCNKLMGDQFITTAELKREAQGLQAFLPVVLARLMRPDSVESFYDLLMEAIFAQQPRVREAVAMLRNRHGIFVRSLCTARLHWLRQTCVLVLSFQPNAFVGVADEPGARRMRIAPPVAAVSNGYAPVGESMAAMGRG